MKCLNRKLVIFFIFTILVYVPGIFAAVVGQAVQVKGDVKALRSKETLIITKGDTLMSGDRISVASKSKLEIKLSTGKFMLLPAFTNLVLEKSQQKGKKATKIHLKGGKLRCRLSPLQADEVFSVKTPVSVVGVRGTDWVQTSDGKTSVLEGKVEVVADGESVLLEKHQKIDFKEGKMGDVQQMLPKEIEQIKQAFKFNEVANHQDRRESQEEGKASEFFIAQYKGSVLGKSKLDKFSKKAKEGNVILEGDLYKSDFGALLYLKNKNKSEIHLGSSSELYCLGVQDESTVFDFRKGKMKAEIHPFQAKLIELEVPYGKVKAKSSSLFYLSMRSDKSVWVDVERGNVEVQHHATKKKEQVKEGKSVLIKRKALDSKDRSENMKKKVRVIFDFQRNKKNDAEPKSKSSSKKNESSSKVDGNTEVEASSVRASDAKLVEGQADGEGEYKYESSNFLLLIIICLAILVVGFIVWKQKKRGTKETIPDVKEKVAKKKAIDTEDEDIFVKEGNLTSHDGVFTTEKTTHINGDIEDGAIIDARHKLVIKGSFQGASMKAINNVSIHGGINGQGKAKIEVEGDLLTPYISEAYVKAGGSIDVSQSIRNANVAADGLVVVRQKNIMGGQIASLTEIECPSLGSDFCETKVVLGQKSNRIWVELFDQELEKEMDADEEEIETESKAELRVSEEIISASIFHGEARVEQKTPLKGPVKTAIDSSDSGKLQFRGYKIES